MVWEIGKTLNNGTYRIEKVLGEGGFGVTYKVRHTRLGIDMVIKTPNDTLQADPEFPKYVQRFEREATILAKLKQVGHPHIVGVNDIFTEGRIPCLVMDFVEGVTLFDLVRDVGVLSPKEAVTYMEQIASALIEVHALPAVHRDAHPGNIMIPRRGLAKLIDFGIAGEVIPTQKISSKVFGHPKFAAPEQWRGNKHPQVDVFTLSASLFFALTGIAPEFDENDALKPIAQGINPKVSDELDRLITDGLKVNRNERPQSMQDWLARLQKIDMVQDSDKSTLIQRKPPIFPRETKPTKVIVPQQVTPKPPSSVKETEPSPPPRMRVNQKRRQPLNKQSPQVKVVRKQHNGSGNLLTAIQRLEIPWKILSVPFGIWTATGYLWQTVDVKYGARFLLHLFDEVLRSNKYKEFHQPVIDRLGSWTVIDAIGMNVSGFLLGLAILVGGYLILCLCLPKHEIWGWVWVEVLGVGEFFVFCIASAAAWGGTSNVTWARILMITSWYTVSVFIWALAITLGKTQEALQKLKKYTMRGGTCLLIGSLFTGASFGWLLYQLIPLFYIHLPSGL